MKTTNIVSIAACLLASTAALAQFTMPPTPTPITPNSSVVEDVVARINDQIITRSDLARSQATLEQELRNSNASPEEVAYREKNLLRDQIDQQLLLSKGKELDITCDTEVIKQLDDLRKQNHLDSMEELEKAAQTQGVNYEDLKASMRNQCITQHVVQQEVGSKIPLTHADVVKYYDEHKAELSQPESIRLNEIIIPVAADANAAAVAAAQAKADTVINRLKAGDKFTDLAKLYSSGPTAAQGGELGVYKRGTLAKEYEDLTFGLNSGQYTQPIRSKQGFVILEVDDHIKAGVPPLSAVENQMEEAVYVSKIQPALRVYLTKLREEAYIKTAPGFIDSGASPNEANVVNSSYVPPAPKVKKVIVRQGFNRDTKNTKASKNAKPQMVPAVAKLDKHGKPKKIKREKVRFGQAPRENLPAAPHGGDLAQNVPAQVGANANTLAPDATPQVAGLSGSGSTPTPDQNADPLAPKAVVKKKSRYSDRASLPKQPKAGPDLSAVPSKPTEAEIEAKKVQAAPLGLNGDTAAKPKKKKLAKGQKKPRLQDQQSAPKPKQDTTTPTTAPVQPVKP